MPGAVADDIGGVPIRRNGHPLAVARNLHPAQGSEAFGGEYQQLASLPFLRGSSRQDSIPAWKGSEVIYPLIRKRNLGGLSGG
jgi:hypothetical protein